jgi:hypothetical protein
MEFRRPCRGLEGQLSQCREPEWGPLVEVVGERLAAGFMWMHEEALENGTSLHAYKHVFTRRYLLLTEDRRAYELSGCGRFVPLRLDFAIEAALCSWWIISGWEAEDVDALREAVVRSAERARPGS